jgi:hypothetical protein
MFRKRHVHIGPAELPMGPSNALSFYRKDRHVHAGLGARASRRS